MKTIIAANSLLSSQVNQHLLNSNKKRLKIEITQEKIYKFFVRIVKSWEPEDVLQEFKRIFIGCLDSVSFDSPSGIYEVFSECDEQSFHNTLKRCCYILINNWETKRKHKYIQELVNLFPQYRTNTESTNSLRKNIFREWIKNFVNSNDYQEIKLFANKYEEHAKEHWVSRYTSYLLVAQSLDKNNPKDQQEAARNLSKQLKNKFKFELAMYIARSQSATSSTDRYKNPSILGDNVLRLIKAIVVKKGVFSYENIANIFIKQTQNQNFQEFKESLHRYLIFSVEQQNFVEILRQHLSEKLSSWKEEYHEEIINKALLLRTCNRAIDCLTTEKGREPSSLFILLLSQGHPLTLVIVLLKIILICRNSRSHLDSRIAHLIRYYDKYPEDECRGVINFLEIFNITFAIYAENVEYNLIKMKEDEQTTTDQQLNLDIYRVFSQEKINAKQLP